MKQPFTIGGSVALKKALLEDIDTPTYNINSVTDYKYLTPFLTTLAGHNKKEPTHYQLPQDWDKAIQAVKEFFAKEKFEKDKWYYVEAGMNMKYLLKVNNFENNKYYCSECIIIGSDGLREDNISYLTYYAFDEKSSIARNSQPATTEQIQFMLGKVAESKGVNRECILVEGYIPAYFPLSDSFNYCGYRVYCEGKWAELLPQEEAKPQTLVLKGVKIIEQIDEEFNRQHFMDLHLTATHLQQLKAYFTA
jgi:hypothetical protein